MTRPSPARCAWCKPPKTVSPLPSPRLITAGEKSDTFTDRLGHPMKATPRRSAVVESTPTNSDPVMAELEACIQTMKAMQATIIQLQGDNARLHEMLTIATSIANAPTIAPPAKRRGRPDKADADNWLLSEFPKFRAEFVAANPFAKPSDRAVLTWCFGEMMAKSGLRASKASSPTFQKKLKTVLNRLSDARHPIRELPD